MELDRRGGELLSQVLTEREERSAIAIASNEPFTAWTKTCTDPRLCAAIVDRLTFAGQIIETGATSYRLAHARRHKTRDTPPSIRRSRWHRSLTWGWAQAASDPARLGPRCPAKAAGRIVPVARRT